MREKICLRTSTVCGDALAFLSLADSVDIDFGADSQTLTVTVFWHAAPDTPSWDETIVLSPGLPRIEIGLLASESSKATRPEEISLGGYLIDLGEDTRPSESSLVDTRFHNASDSASRFSYC